MDINDIKDLFTQFDHSTLTEFQLKEGSFELYMNKNQQTGRDRAQAVSQPVINTLEPVVETAAQPVSVPAEPAAASTTSTEDPEFAGTAVVSPIVGVVYLQPSPDQPAFKAVGDTVKKGEVLCIIEAMKLMNEITSDVDGVIADVLVSNEAIVEYGQSLFQIKTS